MWIHRDLEQLPAQKVILFLSMPQFKNTSKSPDRVQVTLQELFFTSLEKKKKKDYIMSLGDLKQDWLKLVAKDHKDQAIWFMNAFWNGGVKEKVEDIWKYHQKVHFFFFFFLELFSFFSFFFFFYTHTLFPHKLSLYSFWSCPSKETALPMTWMSSLATSSLRPFDFFFSLFLPSSFFPLFYSPFFFRWEKP